MRIIALTLIAMVLMAALPVNAQEVPTRIFEVPVTGYSGNDTYSPNDQWNMYQIHVPNGYELEYSFEITGQGNFNISLVNGIMHDGVDVLYSWIYPNFSVTEESSYSATIPIDHGFDKDYTILINSTYNAEYTASISINEIETPDYTIYYILIILGFIGLVVFSYKLVVWQDKQEKKEEQTSREQRKSRRGKRRR